MGDDDLIDGHGEGGLLTGQIGVVRVGVGEGHIDIEGLAGLVADELLQEIIDVAGDADGDLGAGALGVAALKFHAVYLAHIVDIEGVAVLNGTVGHILLVGVAGHNGIDLLLNILFLYGQGAFIILDAGVLAEGDIVLQVDAVIAAVGGQTETVIDSGIAVALLPGTGGQGYAQHQRHQHGQHFYKLVHFASSKLAAAGWAA